MTESKRELERLFGKYKAYVYTICHQYTRSKEDALDLTQEVFLKAYKNIHTVRVQADLKPWIRRITVNTCINFNRDKKDTLSLEHGEEGLTLKDTLQGRIDTEEDVLGRITLERLKGHILHLPPDVRMALLLRHMQGYSYREIANAMELSESTIKGCLYKGRQTLLKKLRQEGLLEE